MLGDRHAEKALPRLLCAGQVLAGCWLGFPRRPGRSLASSAGDRWICSGQSGGTACVPGLLGLGVEDTVPLPSCPGQVPRAQTTGARFTHCRASLGPGTQGMPGDSPDKLRAPQR